MPSEFDASDIQYTVNGKNYMHYNCGSKQMAHCYLLERIERKRKQTHCKQIANNNNNNNN